MGKFKAGDRVRAIAPVGNDKKTDVIGTIRVYIDDDSTILVEFDEYIKGHNGSKYKDGHCWWVYSDSLELVNEVKESTETTVTTEPDYTNACWFCRKGGLVDLYLNGRPGICPKCGRVMGVKGVKRVKAPNKPNTPTPTPTPDDNRPLTTEELKALPDGTRVFTVWCKDGKGEPTWDRMYTNWRTKKGDLLKRDEGGTAHIDNNNKYYIAYLTEQKKPS